MLLNRLFLIPYLIFLTNSCNNNDYSNSSVQLTVTTDTTRASIGDLISYKIFTHNIGDKYFQILPREFPEPLELRNSKLLYDKRKNILGSEFIFSVWDTGKVTIPPITINLFNSDSIFDFAMDTDSIVIEVVSMAQLMNNQNMLPIKGPMPINTIFPIRIVILILLLLIILCGLFYTYGKRVKKINEKINTVNSLEPADRVALKKLDLLNSESDYTNVNIKEFYIHLSYILREYVENSVYIKSLEMTTEEIIRNRNTFPFRDQEIDNWIDVLHRADLSKYAKSNPKKNICVQDLEAGKNFIMETSSSWKISKD